MLFTVGARFTVIEKVIGGPGQALSVGVTVIVDVIAVTVEFVAVNDAIFPEPEALKPVAVLLFDQAYVAPEVPEKVIAVVD
jgi:hypothetical protein